MNSGIAGRRKEVESALLDYHRTPGKYPLLLRRPEILFSSIKAVLQLASGRLPEGALPPGLAVQRAAGFFVRTALLYPAADHYALLGLERSADPWALKERYRQMMRLMHPDFASSAAAGGDWPADAASRINQAYEVLASPAQRRSYDDQHSSLTAPAPDRAAATQSVARIRAVATSAPAPDPRRRLKRMAGAFGLLGAVALGASLLARGPDRESLVQRATPRPSAAVAAVAQSDAGAPPDRVLLQQMASSEVAPAPLLASAPALHDPLAAPPASPKLEPVPPAALPTPPPVQLPVAIEASAERGAAAPMASVRTASLAPMQPMPARMIAVSIDMTPAPALSTPSPAALVAQAPAAPSTAAPAAVPPRPATVPVPAVTMAEAHALLSALLQQMESGSGERLLNGLDRSARNASSAQGLVRQYNTLVEGARSVKVSNVLLKADPREDRLLVRGQVLLEIGDYAATRIKELSLEAEFVKRNGAVVMTRLAGAPATGLGAQ